MGVWYYLTPCYFQDTSDNLKLLYADFWRIWLTIWLCMCILFLSQTCYYGIWDLFEIVFEMFKTSQSLCQTLSQTHNCPFAYILPPTLTTTKTPAQPAWISEEMAEYVHITYFEMQGKELAQLLHNNSLLCIIYFRNCQRCVYIHLSSIPLLTVETGWKLSAMLEPFLNPKQHHWETQLQTKVLLLLSTHHLLWSTKP